VQVTLRHCSATIKTELVVEKQPTFIGKMRESLFFTYIPKQALVKLSSFNAFQLLSKHYFNARFIPVLV
jgi:hypothetical protein